MKKLIGAPRGAPGPQYEFFELLQRFVRAHTPLALEKIVIEFELHFSYQALHRALIGPRLPSRDLAKRIVAGLGGSAEEMAAIFRAYDLAVEDRIASRHDIQPTLTGRERETPSFSALLNDLYQAAGAPSLAYVEQESRRSLSRSSVSDWLNGRSVPSRPDASITLYQVLVGLARIANPDYEVPRQEVWESLRYEQAVRKRANRSRPRSSRPLPR